MTEEPEDYEGPWPSEDAMTKPTVDEVMLLVREFGDAQAQLASYRSTSNRRECLLRVRAAIESLIAAPTAPQPDSGDLYWRLHSLSKSMEGRGHIDEGELPDAYPALLDAMAFVRGWSPPAEPQEHTGRWNIDVDDSDGSLRICKGEHEKSEACVYERYVPESKAPLSMDGKPAAPQQAKPVGYFQRDCDYFEQVEDVYQWDADVIPLYLHPPPAEVQRLREAAMAVVDAYRNIGPVTVAIEDLSRAL